MNTDELKKLATYARSMREMGLGLLFISALLALIMIVPFRPMATEQQAIVVQELPVPDAYAGISIEADAAIVYDLITGVTLFEKNADAQLPLASLTKLLTVYAALVTLAPTTPITIPSGIKEVEGAHTFSVGQVLMLMDIARLTLTASLNDGAVAIASAVAERQNLNQSEMLAGAAAGLGLAQTYAVNGSGLDLNSSVSGGYGSARDLARLSGALVNIAPDIAEATTRESATATSVGGTNFKVINTDPFVDSIPHLLLSKTGYTDLAGGNLSLVFDVGINHPIAVVVLNSTRKARFTDATRLVSSTLAHFANIASI